MNKRDILEIGIKLLGVYCLILSISTLPVAALYITNAIKGSETLRTILIILSSLQPIIFFCLGFILILRADSIINRIVNDSTPSSQVSEKIMDVVVWIRLIGLYLVAASIGGLLDNIALTVISRGQSLYDLLRISSHVVTIFIGLYFIFKGDKVATFIEPKKSQNI
jgi:hypothetical protein